MSDKTDCSNQKQKDSSVQSNFQPKIVCQYTLIKQPLDHQESNTQTKANEWKIYRERKSTKRNPK